MGFGKPKRRSQARRVCSPIPVRRVTAPIGQSCVLLSTGSLSIISTPLLELGEKLSNAEASRTDQPEPIVSRGHPGFGNSRQIGVSQGGHIELGKDRRGGEQPVSGRIVIDDPSNVTRLRKDDDR